MDPALKACVEILIYLKENVLVNHPAVSQINSALELASKQAPAAAPVAPQEPKPAVRADRRSEERDPGETEQHVAEDLKLAPKVSKKR